MLIGNMTRDPEIRFTANGTSVATLGLATNRTWKDANGEQQESAQFHNLVAWGKMADICQQILAKGMLVYVEGELNTRSWEGDDGVTRYKTEIRISEMKMLDSRGKQGAGPSDGGDASQSASSPAAKSAAPADDSAGDDAPIEEDPTADLPF